MMVCNRQKSYGKTSLFLLNNSAALSIFSLGGGYFKKLQLMFHPVKAWLCIEQEGKMFTASAAKSFHKEVLHMSVNWFSDIYRERKKENMKEMDHIKKEAAYILASGLHACTVSACSFLFK